ncbi:glycoside hydrolase family 2 protein [Aestuariivivens sediminis]|uniref:glycoside hydrolase family 2 protein n=1 Tax=Aestuariivivens sediminis TaxID=2913557 RepID=UPI001F55C098|nr:sugar-binding domain-containing protein [Aestuariivivens sediminis]
MYPTKLIIGLLTGLIGLIHAQKIPLPEHPRPDFERVDWVNLNGKWAFKFDKEDVGLDKNWHYGDVDFEQTITVPFPWGSEASGVKDEADIAWYKRDITVNASWKGKRTFVVIGASDWETTVWLDGQKIGSHQGGYTPFSFEITDVVTYGKTQRLVVRVDDVRRDFTLYGKQGYGNARGIWQTIYLEGRGTNYLDALHFTPDIDQSKVTVTAYLPQDATEDLPVEVQIQTDSGILKRSMVIPKGKYSESMAMDIPDARLWDLDHPYLYDVTANLGNDRVKSYFGMRKISVVNLPGTDYPYIALNNKPIYLQLTLDQSYHPKGFYTFPSDQFIKEEIMRSKSIGLNGIRPHIKVEIPRKLYWADKLGLLVMADLPNSWGEPDRKMQAESEYTLREMIKRDYNHPAIFSWIVFNETWGLKQDDEYGGRYLPSTQNWVASMYYLAKSLDATRLVEDNSICCGYGHTETDINSWHSYLPGYQWEEFLKEVTDSTYPGSGHHFEEGFHQSRQPNINSECGNVWGYEGSTGDVDWSWDYHKMINAFRKYPQVAGWLYTEHHDVINEWNGYWKFDRSNKFTGIEELVPGMALKDFHSDIYLSTGVEISKDVEGGETISVPLTLSVMTDKDLGKELHLNYRLTFTNALGERSVFRSGTQNIPYAPWLQKKLSPLELPMPEYSGLALLTLELTTITGQPLSKNFMHFIVDSQQQMPMVSLLEVQPKAYSNAVWSKILWEVMDGKKINGTGKGFFEYSIALPSDEKIEKAKETYFIIELSAKELFVKDYADYNENQDFMKGSRVANSSNPNAYPMTDETKFSSEVVVSVNGSKVMDVVLEDDPADHRGVLSWHNQLRDGKLREPGSYGYLVKVPISKSTLKTLQKEGDPLVITFQTKGDGGIAVYGKDFGRYAINPALVISY